MNVIKKKTFRDKKTKEKKKNKKKKKKTKQTKRKKTNNNILKQWLGRKENILIHCFSQTICFQHHFR
jgi:hypothetical protein